MRKGIPAADIRPRENVFTYAAWRRKGRQVMKGEHGVKIPTVIDVEKTVDPETGAAVKVQKSRTATVFHVSQTKPLDGPEPEGRPPLPASPADVATPRPAGDGARIAESLREKADNLQPKIANLTRPMTQRHTVKRYSQYCDRMLDGENLERVQVVLRRLADLHEAGSCPEPIAHLRAVSHLEPLVRRRTKTVPQGYHPYRVLAEGYWDGTPQGVQVQSLLNDDARPAEPAPDHTRREIQKLETALRGQKIEGFFPTPRSLARDLVKLADIRDHHEVLEPSAGIGSIAEVIRDDHPRAQLVCVELRPQLVEVLTLKGFETFTADFLDAEGEVDRIVMNPPFERGQDIDHLRHAYSLLRPGGRLVAIISQGPLFRSDAKCQGFRNWLDRVRAERSNVIDDAFNHAEAFRTTGVRVAVVVIDKSQKD